MAKWVGFFQVIWKNKTFSRHKRTQKVILDKNNVSQFDDKFVSTRILSWNNIIRCQFDEEKISHRTKIVELVLNSNIKGIRFTPSYRDVGWKHNGFYEDFADLRELGPYVLLTPNSMKLTFNFIFVVFAVCKMVDEDTSNW